MKRNVVLQVAVLLIAAIILFGCKCPECPKCPQCPVATDPTFTPGGTPCPHCAFAENPGPGKIPYVGHGSNPGWDADRKCEVTNVRFELKRSSGGFEEMSIVPMDSNGCVDDKFNYEYQPGDDITCARVTWKEKSTGVYSAANIGCCTETSPPPTVECK